MTAISWESGFVLLAYSIGFGSLAWALWDMWRAKNATNWPTTSGTIHSLTVVCDDDSDGPRYEVKVDYGYTVDGVAYLGNRISFGYAPSLGRAKHEQIERKLRSLRSVSVSYQPDNPSVSCLSPGISGTAYRGVLFGIVWLAVCTFGMIVYRHTAGTDEHRSRIVNQALILLGGVIVVCGPVMWWLAYGSDSDLLNNLRDEADSPSDSMASATDEGHDQTSATDSSGRHSTVIQPSSTYRF